MDTDVFCSITQYLSFQGFMSNEQSTNVCLLFVLYFTVPSNLLNSVSDNKKSNCSTLTVSSLEQMFMSYNKKFSIPLLIVFSLTSVFRAVTSTETA